MHLEALSKFNHLREYLPQIHQPCIRICRTASGIQKANNTVGFVTGGLTFTCAKNNFLDLHTYPRPKKDPKHNEIVGVEQVFAANKFTVNVGKSPYGTGARLDFNVGAAGTNYINPSLVIPEPAYNDLGVIGVSRLGDGSNYRYWNRSIT